jgi:hypothetical protein
MSLGIQNIIDNVASHAMSTGYIDTLVGYLSKQSPTNGITAAIYVESITPIKSSGLSNTSIRLELEMQIYSSTYQEPYDTIDSGLVLATDAVFTNFIGDFDLGGESRHIDIFGAHGRGLYVRSGYFNLDGKEFRVFQIMIPIIVDDVWAQAA